MTSPTLESLPLVKVSVADGVAVLSINRPDALNSINPALVYQLHQIFERAAADPAVRGLVVAGEGKAFVVGADVDFFVRNIASGDIARIVKFTEAGHALLHAIATCPKPVVARVHGAAWGAGTELALACRHVVATAGASFALPEVGLGIYPGFGGTQRAPRKLGVGIAKWMIFTGKTLSANDACRAGLVDEVVLSDRLDEVSRALALSQYTCQPRPAKTAEMMAVEQFFAHARAEDLRLGTADTDGAPALERAMRLVTSKPSIALSMAEQIIDQGLQCDLSDALRLEIIHLTELFQTSEARLGLQSRAGKRLG